MKDREPPRRAAGGALPFLAVLLCAGSPSGAQLRPLPVPRWAPAPLAAPLPAGLHAPLPLSRPLLGAPLAPLLAAPERPRRLEGRELLESLHESSGRGFRSLDYDDARRLLFTVLERVELDGEPGLVDAFSGSFVQGAGLPTRGGGLRMRGINTEHLWPQQFFASEAPMQSDLFHLLPTLGLPNRMRSSLPFGEVVRAEWANGLGARMGGGLFEPPDAVKGRVARGLFYFYVRYRDRAIRRGAYTPRFWNSMLPTLLEWNRSFPPGQAEREFNELVEQYQGNRNPFIDRPKLADRIGEAGFRE